MKNVFMSSLNKIKSKFGPMLHKKSNQALDLFNNFTIRRRLIFFFLLVSLGPIFIIGTISYMSSKGAIESKISKYSQHGLSQTSLNLEMKMQAIENISTQYITSAKANDVIKEFNDAKDGPELFIKTRPVTDLLQTSVITNKDIYSALFISASDPTRYVVSGSIAITYNGFIEGLQKSGYYKQVLAKEGKAVWSSIKLTKDQYLIAMGRKIIAPLSGEELGIFIIFLNEKSIGKIVNNSNDSEEGQNIQDNFTMIINQRGFILSSPFAEDLGKSVTNLINNPQKLQPLLTSKKDTDDFLCKIKNQNVLVTGRVIGDAGWYILNIAKTSYLYRETTAVGWITFIFGIIFGIIAIIISIYIALSISIPLNQVVYSMRQAENGDFTVRANVKRKDELGYLGASFDHMIEKIGNLLKDTKDAMNAVLQNSNVLEDSSHQSAKTAEAIATAIEEISKGTMEQTTEAENSSNKMNDLAQQIEVVVTKASEVEQISGSTRELSLRSKNAVELLIHKTNETDQITETIVKDIVDLSSSASEIRDITEVITGISEQTNLLALNASIEAARAGEMGLGFAVVAEEVTKLAIQSSNAAKTINSILKNIQQKTEISSKTAEKAHQIIEEQRVAVKSALDAFAEITTATGDIIGRIIFVNHLINDMNRNKEYTLQSIMNISSISEQAAASAQEVSASSQEQTALAEQVKMMAQELRKKSEELADSIAKFRV